MAINLNQAGYFKSRKKAVGILWAADSTEFKIADITDATTPLPSYFWDCGSVSQDGITISENTEEGDAAYDYSGNVVEVSEATSAPSVTFTPLQQFDKDTLKVIYNQAAIKVEESGLVTISGDSAPSNKTLVLDLALKNNNVRILWPETSFASRGDQSITPDELASQEITYNVLTPTGAENVYRFSQPKQ